MHTASKKNLQLNKLNGYYLAASVVTGSKVPTICTKIKTIDKVLHTIQKFNQFQFRITIEAGSINVQYTNAWSVTRSFSFFPLSASHECVDIPATELSAGMLNSPEYTRLFLPGIHSLYQVTRHDFVWIPSLPEKVNLEDGQTRSFTANLRTLLDSIRVLVSLKWATKIKQHQIHRHEWLAGCHR